MKIKIPLLDLRHERITDNLISELELHENYVHYTIRCYSQYKECAAEDPALEQWSKTTLRHREQYASRANIVGIGMTYVPDLRIWQVFMTILGVAADLEFYFQRESEAKAFLDKIARYSNFYDASTTGIKKTTVKRRTGI